MHAYYGHLARTLHTYTDQALNQALAKMELTSAQGHIIGYLCRCQEPPCSRDLERHFDLSHPTVSGLLSRMEKKGFVETVQDPLDRRCKRIHITEKGKLCHKEIHNHIERIEALLAAGLTQDEQTQLQRLLMRVIENAKGVVA